MRLTLAAATPLLARFAVQGACATDPRVLEKINEARQRLMEKPQMWKGKVQRFLFCASKACVTLPREIETVEAATVCNQPMKMRGPWYDVLDSGPGSGGLCNTDAVIDRGDGYVTFADFDQPRNVKVYADVPETSTARMLLQGFDENGNRVRTWDDRDSAYVDGEYVAISNESPAVSVTVFSVLDGIQKPETNGYVRVYAFTAGSAGAPSADTSIAFNWTDSAPQPGNVVWEGDLLSAAWTGVQQDLSLIFQIFYEPGGDGLWMSLYSNTVHIQDFVVDSWTWTPNAGPVTAAVDAAEFGGFILAAPPFDLVVSNIAWNPAMAHGFYLLFRGDGEGDGAGTLYVYDSLGTQISAQFYTIPAGASFTFTPDPLTNPPFASAILSGDADMTQLFNLGVNYAFHVTQTEIGTLAFTTQAEDATPPQNWNGTLAFTDILSPDLLNGTAFYTIGVTRDFTDAVTPVADYLSLLAIQHPDETHPSYRRYEVPALRRSDDAEETDQKVIIMAKLRYLPVKRATDFLVIENIGALKQMLLAINAEEKNEFDLAQKLEAKAEKILGDELQNHIGDAATNNQPMQVQQDCWAAGDIPCIL